MGGRFLGKRFTVQDGFSKGQGDDSPGVFFEGDTLTVNRPVKIEGQLNASSISLGAAASSNLMTAMWKTVYTWNMGAIVGAVGSVNTVIAVDVAMSGAAIGDTIIANAVGSIDTFVGYDAAIYSAANVNLRAWYTGSTGALTPGNVPFKITCIKI